MSFLLTADDSAPRRPTGSAWSKRWWRPGLRSRAPLRSPAGSPRRRRWGEYKRRWRTRASPPNRASRRLEPTWSRHCRRSLRATTPAKGHEFRGAARGAFHRQLSPILRHSISKGQRLCKRHVRISAARMRIRLGLCPTGRVQEGTTMSDSNAGTPISRRPATPSRSTTGGLRRPGHPFTTTPSGPTP